MKFGMSVSDFKILEKEIISPLKEIGAQVWIFGSRATGKHSPFSDVDMMYELGPDQKIPEGLLFKIKDALEESRFPYKLDLVERNSIASSYRDRVEAEKIRL